MFGGILLRSIFMELVKVFLLALTAITTIVTLAVVVMEASRLGLGLSQILLVVPLAIPSMLPYIIPTTTLFTACITFGRLAHDNEILAIKAAGAHPLRVLRPAVVLGLLASAGTWFLYQEVIPHTHHILRTAFTDDPEDALYLLLRRDHEIRIPGLKYYIAVKGMQGRRLIDPIMKRMDEFGLADVIVTAREAELRYDANNRKILVRMWHGDVENRGKGFVHFEYQVWEVPYQVPDKSERARPREMTYEEIRQRRAVVVKEMEEVALQVATNAARLAMLAPPADLPLHVTNLKAILRGKQLEINSLDTEVYMRPALALGCLFFVLVGCPVGIWFSRSDYLSAFITCFLPIICLYYPLQLCCTNLAKNGRLPPGPAVWIANGVIGVIALGLFRRLLRN